MNEQGEWMQEYSVKPIGFIRSKLKDTKDAPSFYTEGAPDARLEVLSAYRDGMDRLQAGDEIIVITWLHQANRDTLKVHPRGNPDNPLTGVFLTRSPDRPNPLGLHRCRVIEKNEDSLLIISIEAIDGTPVLDIKPVVAEADDS
jgi:tRNA-Thr(GGU) m(6)t(6)A37 methyltransferase TsaA